MNDLNPSHVKFLEEELTQTRLQRQQLEEDLEQHIGFRNSCRHLWQYGKAGIWFYAQKIYHRYLSAHRKKIRRQQQSNNPDYKPYIISVKQAVVTKPKRILHAIASFSIGGSQQLIVDIIEGTSDLFDHIIIVYNDYGWKYYKGVPIIEMAYTRNEQNVLDVFKQLQPDIVHVHYWGNRITGYEHWRWYHQVFQAAFTFGSRVIENCNNPIVPYFNEKIDRYAYVSRYARDYFGLLSSPNKIIYPGSNFLLFTRSDEEEPPKDCIGMVYRLDRDKLNAESIDVFIKVIQLRPQTRALIVGNGFYAELYRQKVAAAGLIDKIEFAGVVSYKELPNYYRRMSLFVAPVHKESFGQVTPFAMNMRIPVAAYNVGALSEILANDDVLSSAGDSDALAEIIVQMLDNPIKLKEIGSFNRKRAQRLFSLNAMVEAYHSMYDELLEHH